MVAESVSFLALTSLVEDQPDPIQHVRSATVGAADSRVPLTLLARGSDVALRSRDRARGDRRAVVCAP
jgi:hypothetical protein